MEVIYQQQKDDKSKIYGISKFYGIILCRIVKQSKIVTRKKRQIMCKYNHLGRLI